MVRQEDSFLLVGEDTMLQYDRGSGTFVELPGKLLVARINPLAIVVDRAIFPACP